MAVLYRDLACPACGHHHNFCDPLPSELPAGNVSYEFSCPETGTKATVRPETPPCVVGTCPQGAVGLTPVTPGP